MYDSHDSSGSTPSAFHDSVSLVVDRDTSGSTGPGSNRERLSVLQREFARQYVLCGGDARRAATLAGYESAKSAGVRNLVNPPVLAEIKRLSIVHVEALLPIMVRQLFDIATDPAQDAKARVLAANSLLDRGGMKPKAAPLVQINQQNNLSGASAQELIRSVWEARSARIDPELSDIPAAMSDSDEDAPEQLSSAHDGAADGSDNPAAATDRGGVQSSGSHPRTRLIPLVPTPSPPETRMAFLWGRGILGGGE